MRNAGLDEAQTGMKIAGRNINHLRYTDDTTFIKAESEEELKIFLMKVKVESENVDLKLNIQKTKIMAFDPVASWHGCSNINVSILTIVSPSREKSLCLHLQVSSTCQEGLGDSHGRQNKDIKMD